MQDIRLPPGFNWREWVERWDRMQERYLIDRAERFAVIIRMIRATLPSAARLIDLGCGPGSLTLELLEAFPQAEVIGIDLDPAMRVLAKARLSGYGMRVKILSADLREPAWSDALPQPCDAVVSATALHWLSAEQLEAVYQQVARVLRPGGIFMNADHVGSDYAPIQKAWELDRAEQLARKAKGADDWQGFWRAFGQALGVDLDSIHKEIAGGWSGGVEAGLPLPWHFHTLKASGLQYVDCFWRSDGDAVYGGIREGGTPLRSATQGA